MSNENQKNEKKQEKKQSTTPAAQVELSDEELEQVVGGMRKAGGDPQPSIIAI
jgi:mersacidin/lichenicidin family type 2 lantibiotic